eukprot:553875-Pyramimonas_sp.AAC.1
MRVQDKLRSGEAKARPPRCLVSRRWPTSRQQNGDRTGKTRNQNKGQKTQRKITIQQRPTGSRFKTYR